MVESNLPSGLPANPPAADHSNAAPCASAPATWLDAGIAVLNKNGDIISLNDSLAIWFEATPGELAGQPLAKLLAQRDAAWGQPVSDFFAQTATFDRLQLPSERAGQRLALEVCRNSDVQFVRLASMLPPARELEELFPESAWGRLAVNETFQRVLRAEAQLENLNYRFPGILFSQRPDFTFAFVSPKIEELTGIPAQEWRRNSKHFWNVVHESDAEPLMARLRNGLRSPSDMTGIFRISSR